MRSGGLICVIEGVSTFFFDRREDEESFLAFETGEFGESIFDELCQVVDIAQDDVEAVVVSAGNVESRFDFGDGKDAIFEIGNRLDLVLSQVDHDESLDGVSNGFWIDDGAIRFDDALFFEVFDAVEHRAFGELVARSELFVGNIGLLLKCFENILVELVHYKTPMLGVLRTFGCEIFRANDSR